VRPPSHTSPLMRTHATGSEYCQPPLFGSPKHPHRTVIVPLADRNSLASCASSAAHSSLVRVCRARHTSGCTASPSLRSHGAFNQSAQSRRIQSVSSHQSSVSPSCPIKTAAQSSLSKDSLASPPLSSPSKTAVRPSVISLSKHPSRSGSISAFNTQHAPPSSRDHGCGRGSLRSHCYLSSSTPHHRH